MSNEPFLRGDIPRMTHMTHSATVGDVASVGVHHREQAVKPVRNRFGAKHIQMFLHGGESSIVTEQGDYQVHRLVPAFVKIYLNWTKDTFPSIVRLSWTSLMSLFVVMKLVTITLFAVILNAMESNNGECVVNAQTFSDYFYFVTQTIFTIGYGNMYPVCHSSNILVTVMSFFGMFQTATFTGIFFAKFSMDPRRNYACAFATALVGIPPCEDDGSPLYVKFFFRFVNVFHRRFFKVSCRMYLVEHRVNPVTDVWLTPVIEEIEYFDSSSPLEFMSLPIEICSYIPFNRLVKQKRQTSHGGSTGVSPLHLPIGRHSRGDCFDTVPEFCHKWTRYSCKQEERSSSSSRGNMPSPRRTTKGGELSYESEFELVCSLVFTDATTGSEIVVRKSWPLSETVWLNESEAEVKWKNIVYRGGSADNQRNDSYYVDVTGLDEIENKPNEHTTYASVLDGDNGGFSGLGSPTGRSDMAYQLINKMTLTRGSRNKLNHAVDEQPQQTTVGSRFVNELFASIPENRPVVARNPSDYQPAPPGNV